MERKGKRNRTDPGNRSRAKESATSPVAGRAVAAPAFGHSPPLSRRIRVLLVEDHARLREAVRMVLQSQSDIEVVGETADGAEGVRLARTLQPDVVVMDISLPHLSGIEATRQITAARPHPKVIALSIHNQFLQAAEMIHAGAVAYVEKAGSTTALLEAIRKCGRSARKSPAAKSELRSRVAQVHSSGSARAYRT